ncbi:MAG: hypothetical protein ABIF77_01695, partial [bacterium]
MLDYVLYGAYPLELSLTIIEVTGKGLVLMPVAPLLVPSFQLPLLPARGFGSAWLAEIPGEAIPYRESTALLETATPARIFPDDTTLAGVLPGDRSSVRSVNRNPRVSWTIWALIGWGTGALLVLLWQGMGWLNAVSLVRRARPLTAGCWRTTADGLLGGRRRYPRPRLLCVMISRCRPCSDSGAR